MKAGVVDRHLEFMSLLEGREIYMEIIDIKDGRLNIIYDENMYITPEDKNIDSKFLNELYIILGDFERIPITKVNCTKLESRLNLLINRYKNMGFLFLESDLVFGMDVTGFIVLQKENHFKNIMERSFNSLPPSTLIL